MRATFAGTHTIKWVSETKVELTDKNKQDEAVACCCPGVVQNFSARHPSRSRAVPLWARGVLTRDLACAQSGASTFPAAWQPSRMSWTFNRINTHPHMRARVSAESSKINSLAAQLAMNVKMKAVVPESMSRDEPKVDIATQLEKLNGLKESGAISEEEFAEAKAKTLAAA